MAFNREKFIQTAMERGGTTTGINNWLTSKGYEPVETRLSSGGGGSQGLTGASPIGSSAGTVGTLQSLLPALAQSAIQREDTVDINRTMDLINKIQSYQESSTEMKDKELTKKRYIEKIDTAVERLRKAQEEEEELTGPISGRLASLRVRMSPDIGIFGEPTETERELWRDLGTIRAEKLFEVGGKRLPAQELKELLPMVPSMNLPVEQNIKQLEELKRKISGVDPEKFVGGAL